MKVYELQCWYCDSEFRIEFPDMDSEVFHCPCCGTSINREEENDEEYEEV